MKIRRQYASDVCGTPFVIAGKHAGGLDLLWVWLPL
jgi:hypothetical protein